MLLAAVVGVVVGIVGAIRAYAPGEGKPRTPSYFDGVFGAKHMAESVVSMAGNLQAIRDAMDRYVSAFGSYPPDLQELVGNGMLPASALRAPDSAKQAYAYIPGQKQSMSGDNILVYEEKPIHRDTCNVLRLGGRIEQLTVEQLNQALEQTRQRIGQ